MGKISSPDLEEHQGVIDNPTSPDLEPETLDIEAESVTTEIDKSDLNLMPFIVCAGLLVLMKNKFLAVIISAGFILTQLQNNKVPETNG